MMNVLDYFKPSLETTAIELSDSQIAKQGPSQVFEQIIDHSSVFWLDSAQLHSPSEHWTFLGVAPFKQLTIEPIKFRDFFGWRRLLRTLAVQPLRATENGPPFPGGWVGYLSYDCGNNKTPSAGIPLIRLNFFDFVLAYEHAKQKWWACCVSKYNSEVTSDAISNRISSLLRQFAPVPAPSDAPAPRCAVSNMTRENYCDVVKRALEHIRAGDIYQINLAQRFSTPWKENPASLYSRLRQKSPAAYGVFLGSKLVDGRHAICSVSPELFLKVRGREVLTRPIKGTRPLGSTPAEIEAARRDLATCAKEIAELNMIVDVERNDLGRVCEYGSVRVQSPGQIQDLPTLLHRVATVSGTLKGNCSAAKLLKATFPGGSITGAPKLKAIEIISELEPEPRGPYCGAIGWLGVNGDLELNIAIRTALVDTAEGVAHFHAGSGIVADSDPEKEYEETLHKARAFFAATNATFSLR
jgi:para-aminobenzoate synthetase component 1